MCVLERERERIGYALGNGICISMGTYRVGVIPHVFGGITQVRGAEGLRYSNGRRKEYKVDDFHNKRMFFLKRKHELSKQL